MIIPVQIYNYFEGYIVSNKIHNNSGVMSGNVPLRLLDLDGVREFYNGNNPMHVNNSLLDHFTNAWIHIGSGDVMKIMNSSLGFKYPKEYGGVIVKSISYGDIVIIGKIMSVSKDTDSVKIGSIFRNSISLLGYYTRDKYLGIIPLNEINVAGYEDWCYLLNDNI